MHKNMKTCHIYKNPRLRGTADCTSNFNNLANSSYDIRPLIGRNQSRGFKFESSLAKPKEKTLSSISQQKGEDIVSAHEEIDKIEMLVEASESYDSASSHCKREATVSSINNSPLEKHEASQMQSRLQNSDAKLVKSQVHAPAKKKFKPRPSPFTSSIKKPSPSYPGSSDISIINPTAHTQYLLNKIQLLDEVDFKNKQKSFMNLEEFLEDNV